MIDLSTKDKTIQILEKNKAQAVPNLMMVQLKVFWLHDGAKNDMRSVKPYFEFWILIFSQASSVQHNLLLGF